MSSQNKTRKRKWDLDDQGKEAPPSTNNPSPPTSKQPKLETANDATGSSTAASPTPSNSESVDPNIAAAVAAAKINAMLAAKGIQVPVKPISVPSKSSLKSDTALNGTSEDSRLLTKESDSEFTKDIIINDCKNRYLLTKGATQQQIQKETNADVTTRGKYYPDKSLATEKDPPLFLHVTAPNQESLDAAIKKIEELMEQAFNPAPATQAARQGNSQHPGGFVQDKVFVGMEPDRTFNARAKIVGPQGAFVKHIQQETGAKVQLKGRGSGYIEPTSGAEAFEPLHIHITCWSQEGLDKAKRLCEDLVNTVKVEWEKHKAQQAVYTYGRSPYPRPPGYGPPPPPGGGYPQPPVNPPLPSGPPPPISGSPPPLLPATSASTTSQPPLPLYPPPPPPLSQPPSASPSSTTQSATSNATSTATSTYDATSSNAYGSNATQASSAPYNPYNPYNQSRYYQQYPQYSNYYAQAQPGTTADPNSYYGFQTASSYATSGYTTASASAPPPQTPSAPSPPASASLPTSGSHYDDKKFNQSSYHAVPPPDSYESEVGSKN